jgi:hypothetical protein
VLQEFHINYITEGSVPFITGEDHFLIVPGSILILQPEMWPRYMPDPNTGLSEPCIGFKGDFCAHFFQEDFFQVGKACLHFRKI